MRRGGFPGRVIPGGRLRPFVVSALLGLVLTAAWSVAAVAGSPKEHGPNLWAGDWRTNTGLVGWRLLRPSEIEDAQNAKDHRQLYDKLPCKDDGPQFYEGGYKGTDSGKVLACGTPTEIEGRWLSEVSASNHGSYSLEISSQKPLTFTGVAVPDGGKSFRWSGAFANDFAGDGANVPFFVDFSVIIKGKPNLPIKGGPNAPLLSARLSGHGRVTFRKNLGGLLEATATKGDVTLDETYAGGKVEHFELGLQSGSLYSPATERLALLLDVKQSDDPQCPEGGLLSPTIATLTLLRGGGVRDRAIFFGVPKSQTPPQFRLVKTTPCKGGHIHGWENGTAGVTVRVHLSASSGS